MEIKPNIYTRYRALNFIYHIFYKNPKIKYPDVKMDDKVTFNELGLSQFDNKKYRNFFSTRVFQVEYVSECSDKGERKVFLRCGTFLYLKYVKVLPRETPVKN